MEGLSSFQYNPKLGILTLSTSFLGLFTERPGLLTTAGLIFAALMAIFFQSEDIDIRLRHKRVLKRWLSLVAQSEGKKLGDINVIWCSDDRLLEINRQFLDHDYYTDIITFDYSSEAASGDLFISIDRVRANAFQFGSNLDFELYRVIVHGVLHLFGYQDKEPLDAIKMREKEEEKLKILAELLSNNKPTVSRGTKK